jgi:hypothetical protein
MKKKVNKLTLNKETVRQLTGPGLDRVVGADWTEPCWTDAYDCVTHACPTSNAPRACQVTCVDPGGFDPDSDLCR